MNYHDMLAKIPSDLINPVEFQFVGSMPDGKLCVGLGATQKIGYFLAQYGIGKVLIISDRTLEKVGTLDIVTGHIKKAGFSVDVFLDIHPEPHIEDFRKAQELVRQNNYIAIIGLGGGSSMDIAKIASALATNKGDVLEYCLGKCEIKQHGIPCILMPTTSGTGSEISPYVVTSADNKKLFIGSPFLLARIALVDPILTVSMPSTVTASTGVDALTHAIEGYIGKSNAITETFTSKSVEYIFKYLRVACSDPTNLRARYYMSWAAIYGMLSYSQGGGLYAHSLSYILTLDKGIAHGTGCGVGLANTIMFNIDYLSETVGKLGKYMLTETDSLPRCGKECVVFVARKIQELIHEIGLPTTLREMNVAQEQVRPYAEELYGKYYRKANPRPMNQEEAIKLLNYVWNGDLKEI